MFCRHFAFGKLKYAQVNFPFWPEMSQGAYGPGLGGLLNLFSSTLNRRSAEDASASEALRYEGYKSCSIYLHSQTKHTVKGMAKILLDF